MIEPLKKVRRNRGSQALVERLLFRWRPRLCLSSNAVHKGNGGNPNRNSFRVANEIRA